MDIEKAIEFSCFISKEAEKSGLTIRELMEANCIILSSLCHEKKLCSKYCKNHIDTLLKIYNLDLNKF